MLGKIPFRQFGVLDAPADMVVMITDRDGENLLCLGLLNDEPVKVIAQLARLEVELANPLDDFLLILRGWGVVGRVFAGRGLVDSRGIDELNVGIPKQVLQLPLEILVLRF